MISTNRRRRTPWTWVILVPIVYFCHLILQRIYGASEAAPPTPFDAPAYAHLLPPARQGRESDITDTFATYKHASKCGIRSTDLHVPFSPLCPDRQSVLAAMSHGGRVGFDTPYIPQGCDMRWYTSRHACEVLNRFSHVFIIGDSLQRLITNSLYVILREDIGLGGITDWALPIDGQTYKSAEDCSCDRQITRKECSESEIQSKDWVAGNSSSQRVCPMLKKFDTGITYHRLLQWPISDQDLRSVSDLLPRQAPSKPPAFLIHQELLSNENATETILFLDQLVAHLKSAAPWINVEGNFPRLYTTANAATMAKGFGFKATQANHMHARFELEMKNRIPDMGMDFLGMFNMSVQTTQWDGAHATLEQNLLKVQMLLNWLDQLRLGTYSVSTGTYERLIGI